MVTTVEINRYDIVERTNRLNVLGRLVTFVNPSEPEVAHYVVEISTGFRMNVGAYSLLSSFIRLHTDIAHPVYIWLDDPAE